MKMTISFRNRTCWCGEKKQYRSQFWKKTTKLGWCSNELHSKAWTCTSTKFMLTFLYIFPRLPPNWNTWGRVWCSFDMRSLNYLKLCPIMMHQAWPWLRASNHVFVPQVCGYPLEIPQSQSRTLEGSAASFQWTRNLGMISSTKPTRAPLLQAI